MTGQPDNGSGTLGEIMPNDFGFHIASRSLLNLPKFDDERQHDVKALASAKARRGDTTLCAFLLGRILPRRCRYGPFFTPSLFGLKAVVLCF
jgi:hypothetical protein